MRCSSSNHRALSCTRFEYWEGKRCKNCGYLHNSKFCPFASKDKDNRERRNKSEKNLLKDNDNSWRNAYQVEVLHSEDNLQNKSESGEYIPKVPQPGARQVKDSSNVFAKTE